MSSSVVEPTVDELREWRRQSLERVGQSLEDLEEREEQGALTQRERNALATVRGIDFLLEGAD